MYQKIYYALLFLIFTFSPCTSQNLIQYKQIDSLKLYLELFSPENMNPGVKYPAMVFFHGGGWINGDRSQFAHQADYFSKRGIVCFLADYRLMDKTKKSPLVCLMDAKSSIRYIRHNAERFGIDPAKLIASGGSAGGHLAAATALIDNYNEITDDVSISCRPDVLVLFNPVIDNGPGGFGYSFVKNEFQFFSPLHNIKKSAPPTIFFLGTNDNLIPVETAQCYKKKMETNGARCDLKLYEGEGHGFFNYNHFENYKSTLMETDVFLQSLGFLDKEPLILIEK